MGRGSRRHRRSVREPGRWPLTAAPSGDPVQVIDVDRFRNLALFLVAVAHHHDHGFPMIHTVGYQEQGGRRHACVTAGTGYPALDLEAVLTRARPPLGPIGVGEVHWNQQSPTELILAATLACAADVDSVVIDRGGETRRCDLRGGPGRLGLIWTTGSEPTVTAWNAAGLEIGRLGPAEFRFDPARHEGAGITMYAVRRPAEPGSEALRTD